MFPLGVEDLHKQLLLLEVSEGASFDLFEMVVKNKYAIKNKKGHFSTWNP